MIDVAGILEAYGIPYKLSGKNIKSGEIGICCPLCGDDDDYHMGIVADGSAFACWKSSDHRGRNLRWLFRKLLNATPAQLDDILGGKGPSSPLANALERARAVGRRLDASETLQALKTHREWPGEFVRIDKDFLRCRMLVKHLIRKRYYEESEVSGLVERFDLRFSSGRWSGRVVFPLSGFDGAVTFLAGFTGRDVTDKSLARYLTDDGGHGKAICYCHDFAETMLLVEGPFDAMRINWTAHRNELPIRAVAFLGTAVVEAQANVLIPMFERYGVRRTAICMDFGAMSNAMSARRLLSLLRPEVVSYLGDSDAGDMDDRTCRRWLRSILK